MAPLSSKRNSPRARGQLGLAHARGTEKQKGADGPVAVTQAGAVPPDGVGHGDDRFILAHHLPVQPGFHLDQLLDFALDQAAHRDTRPLRDDLGDVLLVHFLLQHPALPLEFGERPVLLLDPAVELQLLAVPDAGHPLVIADPLRPVGLDFQLLGLFLDLLDRLHQLFLGEPVGPQDAALLLQVGQPAFHGLEAFLRVPLALDGFPLDFELADLLFEVVQFGRHAVDLHAQVRRGFVDQVDGLVRHEPVADVPLRQGCGGDQRAVPDADAVVDLVAFLESAQNRHGVFDGRLADVYGREPPLQGGVFLDMLAVFVQGRRAHAAQGPPRQRRLEHVGRVHGAFRGARADDGVQLVDEQDDVARGVLHFLQHGLETLLELARGTWPRPAWRPCRG